MRLPWVMLICTALACSSSSLRRAEGRPLTVAILPFDNASTTARYDVAASAVDSLLSASLSIYEEVALVERRELKQVLGEMTLELSGTVAMEQRHQVGRLLGARILIAGSLSVATEGVTLRAHVIDIETSVILFSDEVSGSMTRLADVASELAESLVSALRAHDELVLAADSRPIVHLHFMRGLGHYYGNRYSQAIEEFLNALFLDEDFPEARYWMAQSYSADGAHHHAAIELSRVEKSFPGHNLAKRAAADLKRLRAEGFLTGDLLGDD